MRGWTTSARWTTTPETSSRSSTALALEVRPTRGWSVAAGADYDLANTWFGNADAMVRYTTPRITVTGGLRQYRPYFDLWTLWGVFSPVPYHAADGAVFVRPIRSLELRARGERYSYSDTETETPLVDVDNDGWRLGFGATYSLGQTWRFDAGYREEYGPGASSHGFDANVTWLPTTVLSINAYGSTLDRPLEFRFNDASVDVLGVDAEWSAGSQLRLAVGGARYWETRDRPDAAAFDWSQTRLHARVTLLFRSESDVSGCRPRCAPILERGAGEDPVARRPGPPDRRPRQRLGPGLGGAAALRPLAASRALPHLRRLPRRRGRAHRRLVARAGELRRVPRQRHPEGGGLDAAVGPTRQQPHVHPRRSRRGGPPGETGFKPAVSGLPR